MNRSRLAGKVAVITGAGSGLGAAAAVRFGTEGAAVMCADLDAGAAERTAQAIRDAGGRAGACAVDVADAAQCEAMAALAVAELGGIDVLYANAGIAGVGSALDTTLETWNRVLAVNLTGVWLSMRAVLPAMLERGAGAIVNQSSIGALVGVPGIAPYAAAKAGVIGLTRQAAVEFGPRGIRVNAICPGTVPTPLVTNTYDGRGRLPAGVQERRMARDAERYPLRRLGTVDDITNVALFLGSDESKWITGAVYVVDGGLSVA